MIRRETYFLDRQVGLLHVRLQTWFPFTIPVDLNGHDWLARQLDRRGLRYRRLDNAFLWLADPGRAQRRADRFASLPWPVILERLARRVNPLLRDLLASYRSYWTTHQAEYATDVLFTSRLALRPRYARLLRHATLCLRAEDVLTFLGRKLHGKFAGEILNDWQRRWPGATGRPRRPGTSGAFCQPSRKHPFVSPSHQRRSPNAAGT